MFVCTKCGEVIIIGPGGCACTRFARAQREKEKHEQKMAWLRGLPGQKFETPEKAFADLNYRCALANLGEEVLGRFPMVTDEGKLHTLVNGSRISLKTPPNCWTPTGRHDSHGIYGEMKDGIFVCSFCKEPI